MRYATLLLLPALVLAGCGDDDDGIQVNVQVAANDLATSYATPSGAVTLHDSYVVVEAVELVACTSVAKMILRALNPLPAAMAHSESSPTLLGTPVVLAVTGAQAATAVGVMQPPPGSYCGAALHLGPADADAVGLVSADVVGATLVVYGEDADGADVSMRTDVSRVVNVAFAQLDLDAEATSATIALEVVPSFDSVDVASATAGAAALENFGWRVTVSP